jgi:ligand-binding SRPBCC domain-containing protein
MKVYSAKYKQFVPSDIETVWDFFSSPDNLSKITPPEMNFEILQITGGERMYPGQLISYKVSPFPWMRVKWTTEIKVVASEQYFIDEQKIGPFALWHHQHFFIQKDDGIEMIDELSYAMPMGILGRMVNRLFVANQVKAIFQYRKLAVQNIFKQLDVVPG